MSKRAKPKPFFVGAVRTNFDAQPWCAVLTGLMRIEGSPQGNMRQIFARLTLEQAEALLFGLQQTIAMIRSQKAPTE